MLAQFKSEKKTS